MTSPFEIEFEIGQIYDRRTDINIPFGGSRQSGIARSARAPAVFLFTGDSGAQYGYTDHYDDFGVFHYTGEGQVGDMKLTGGNKAILEHARLGQSLHLFKALGKRVGVSLGQRYMGEFACADHYWDEGKDREGKLRKIVRFLLVPVGRIVEGAVGENAGTALPSTLEKARELAMLAMESRVDASPGAAIRNIYTRSAQVKNYVLLRAAGTCESCDKPAPFFRNDGSPYLEPHHINRLSDGGLDHPLYVGAVCPACHREIHYGLGGSEKNELLRERVVSIEKEISESLA
ncbi:HNH endonuclease [Pseudomonas nitroreducens]|uniref:HNH endonuclease n=1 Tax=Pseudomonas nitroreducens TaxID=46680 RepID=UPI002D7E5B7A|nr:HNH endonuclease signature motif containing protein [Pseudomonas nitroreducens]